MDSETLLRGIQLTQSQIDERIYTTTQRSRMHLKLFVNESTFTERLRFYFIKNQTTSLRIRLFKFTIKVVTVILYLVRTGLEDSYQTHCCGMCPKHLVNSTTIHIWQDQYNFSWSRIVWVERHVVIWYMQVILSIISLVLEGINTYVNYKGNLSQQIISTTWILEIFFCSLPFVATIFWKPLRCLFVPVFLNIWLAKAGLESMINDLHRVAHKQQSAMFNQVCILMSTLLCLSITCICGVQHLERAGEKRIDLFDGFWFVMVTFSTVGYGDITPTIWPTKLLVICTIFVALGIIPSQVEQISFLWSESQRQGGEYSRQRAKTEKHVVVCATVLRMDVILDFLNEFYAHPVLQNYYVVLLSPVELDGPLKRFLLIPIWAERVIYIQGSVLRDIDLVRVKMDAAEACFMLTSRQEVDRVAADEKTILRSMAVKDFAPRCPLYVQILRPESMIHVQFADRVICDDEFKHLLLAMNSYIPGISTIITLLAHTSKGQEGENLNSVWKREFGRSAGNEIYSVIAQESKFFGDFVGCKFSSVSMMAHSKCGATLFAVERSGEVRINPGNEFLIDPDDTLFYICLTQEEDAMIVRNRKEQHDCEESSQSTTDTIKCVASCDRLNRLDQSSVKSDVFEQESQSLSNDKNTSTTLGRSKIAFPPVSPYIGHNTPTMCHVLEEKAKSCCIRLDRPCEHCRHTSALHYNWNNPPIIVSAEFAAQSLFNVMVPLRAHHTPKHSLHPIVLLLEHSPESNFLSAISCFPMVYYMLGGMNGLDSLLHAGVVKAHSVIIMDRETSMYAEEEYMADSRQLVATQTMYRLFPAIPTCLELTHASNMRFMHFSAPDPHIDQNEFRKEREKEKSCSLPYLFRPAFASGKVFSSSMLDTLLYQSFVKDYLMTLLRIMLGLQYTSGSGHLSTHKVSENETGKTYHNLFRSLSGRKGCILLGIYRYETSMTSQTEIIDDKNDMENATDVPKGRKIGKLDSVSEEAASRFTPRRRTLGNMSISTMKHSLKSRFSLGKRQSLRRLHLLQSTKSDREKLDEMIQFRMRELELCEPFESPIKHRDDEEVFGYILLNPAPDVVLKSGDILYVINPELMTEDSRSSSCLGDHTDDTRSIDELIGDVTITNEQSSVRNVSFKGNDEKNPKIRRISAIDEECDITKAANRLIENNETSKV